MKAAVAAMRMLLLSFKWETGNSDRDESRRDGGQGGLSGWSSSEGKATISWVGSRTDFKLSALCIGID